MTSAEAAGWLSTTSARPTARNTGSRTGRIATTANAAKASAAATMAHGRPKILLRFIESAHESAALLLADA